MKVSRDDARRYDGDQVVSIDVDDARHSVRREDDTARDRNRPTRPARTRCTWCDGDPMRLANPEGRDDVLSTVGEDDRVRGSTRSGAVVTCIRLTRRFGRVDPRWAETPLELGQRLLHVSS